LLWRTPWLKRILNRKGTNKTVKKTTSGQDKTSIKSA